MKIYQAPWSACLHIVSWLVTTICVVTEVAGVGALQRHGWSPDVILANAIPPTLVFSCALFTVRRYTITERLLIIRRLFWSTEFPLEKLASATADSDAFRRTIRTCGNGGFYSFTGWYWNKRLGSFRAFVTDPKRSVVLKFDNRTIVVSPDDPESFVRALTPA